MSDDFDQVDPDFCFAATRQRGPRPGFWEGRAELIGSNLGQDWRKVASTEVARRGVESGPVASWLNKKLGSGIDFATRETGRAIRGGVREIREQRSQRRSETALARARESASAYAERWPDVAPTDEEPRMSGGAGHLGSGRRPSEQHTWTVD